MAEINDQIVRYVARLARLEFDDGEIAGFTEKFKNILDYVETLNELDVTGVEPTYSVMPVDDTMRDDEAKPSCPVEKILSNAPDRKSNFFRVPRVVE